ncbi:vWA domain-containing protein [Nannocystis bainbridge]|uniref:VWA domain-containing protein n=1 Tax=Nannocystis bainbridge TaxID=2995303 RepID=A0ABT5E4Z3_9BACT|nr:VWA domain-containing protein [Nannocystis bainbridge]MDC0720937.1 VWA domain-containing protein [Nannocystis bainbridge]
MTLAVGCGDDAPSDEGSSATNASSPVGTEGGSGGEEPGDGWGTDAPGDSGGASTSGGDPGGGGTDSGPDSGGGSDTDTGGEEPIDPGQLTAGEWRDLDHWDFWIGLLGNDMWSPMQNLWKLYTSQRFAVVALSEQAPVVDAEVVLLGGDQKPLWSARTDVRGRAELFNGLVGAAGEGPFTIEVSSGESSVTLADVQPFAGDPAIANLDAAEAPAKVLDLLFMIDTTGSMGDELEYLQVELADVISEIRDNIGQSFKLRLSVNFYRDHDDEYVVREFPFTEDIDAALADLAAQNYDGGGDFPEAVSEALDATIHNAQWSASAVSRLAFLVLDAPPHEGAQDLARIQESVVDAAAAGVRIIPVASSGIDKNTEFFLRFIDIATGGTYVFLTGHSGIGGEHIEPTIGEYQVELLNRLLVRLITQSVQVD